ncbi:MAG: hypothetical protein IPO37_03175 [Saprospiraceae bacterium]|nr:hypothetical protein [Saprospiraceae bacterium]
MLTSNQNSSKNGKFSRSFNPSHEEWRIGCDMTSPMVEGDHEPYPLGTVGNMLVR